MMICAYCKKDGVVTREHVIPAFIYRFQKEIEGSIIGWNEKANKMVGGEHKIRDVCKTCNGGVLSTLDGYGKSFLIASGFLTKNYSKLTADFTYEYDQLARWLLKISFNATRTDQAHSHLFEKFIPFMLEGEPLPSKTDFAIVAALAAPIKVEELQDDYDALRSLADEKGRVNPFFMRIAYAPDKYQTFTLRIVMFGPLTFFLLMFLPGVPVGISTNETKRFLKATPNTLLLQRGKSRALLKVGTTTWLEYYVAQVHRINAVGGYQP